MRDENKTKEQLIRELQNGRQELDKLKASGLGLASNSIEQSAPDFRQLMEFSPDGILVVGSEGELYLINPTMARMLGTDKGGEILEKNFFAFLAPEQLEGCRNWFKNIIGSSGQKKEIETIFLRVNGAPFPVEVAAAPLLWKGKPSVQIIARDATEHRRVEQELRQLNQELQQRAIDRGIAELEHAKERALSQTTLSNQTKLLQSIIDSMGEALIVANDKFEVTLSNRTAKQMTGKRIRSLSPQSIEESIRLTSLYLPDKVTPYPLDQLPLVCAIRGESVDDAEVFVRNQKVSGGGTWLLCNSRPLRDEQGNLQGGVIVFKDNTERKHTEEILRESEATLRSFYDGASMMMGVIELVGDDVLHISVNQATANFFGTTQEAMCNKLASELGATKALSQAWIQAYNQSAQTGKPVRFEYLLEYKNEERTLSATVSYIEKTSGGRQRFSYVVEDITERKRIEEAVKESEERYRHLVNNAGDIIYQADAEGRIILLNPTATRILGYTEEELLGRHYLDVVHPDYHRKGEKFYGRQFVKKISETYFEFPALAKDGTIVWLGQKVQLVINEDRVVGFEVIARDITERKREQEALKASEERFSKVFHASPLPMNIRRLDDGRFVDVNEAYLRAVGFLREEVLGRTPVELGVWVEPAEYEAFMEIIRQGKPVRNLETRYRLKTGGIGVGLVTAVIIEADGQQCVLVINADITKRKREEQALQASEERFSKVFQASPLAMNIRRLDDGRFVGVNEAYLRALGLSREEVIGRTPLELGVWENLAEYETFMELVRREKTVRNFECRLLIKAGKVAICLLTAEIIEVDGQQGVLTITTNITKRKRAEEALAASEKRFSRAFHSSPMAMNIRRLDDGRFVDVNETYLRAVGLSRQQVLGRTPVELRLWENSADYEQFMEMIKRGESVRNLECRLLIKGGRIAVVLVTAELIEVDEQQCVLVISNDITKLKREQEALKASEERFSRVFQACPLAMTIRRLDDGRYVDGNTQYLRATGQKLEEILGKTPVELGLWENPAEYEIFMEMVRRGQTVRDFECRLRMKTGKEAICLFTAEIIEVDGQQCVLVITTNITERKRAEEEREQLISQLQEALAKVKTLSGFLPICASCKKIRDDKGYWNQIEEYIHDHSDAEFSHSICPTCSENLYGEFFRKREHERLNKLSKP